MKFSKLLACTFAALVLAAGMTAASAAMSASDKKKAIADIQKMERETLAQLFKLQPGAKGTIEKSAGYAVFSNFGIKIFVAGSGKGAGVATNSKTKQKIYMKMLEVQAGVGIGVKKFRLVWVFDSENALNNFVNSGMEVGGQASATAKKGAKGDAFTGAMQVSPGVWLYQLAGDGLALELTAKGTKYYKDDELN